MSDAPKAPEAEEKPKRAGGRPRKEMFEWPIAETKKQAAEILGWPPARVTQAQKAGSPGFRHGRVYVGELIAWMGSAGLDDAEVDWARELKKEQTLKLQAERSVREGRSMDYEQAAEGIQRAVALLLSELDKTFCSELPPDLKGLQEIEIRTKCQAAIEALKSNLRAKFDEVVKVPSPDVQPSNDDGTAANGGGVQGGTITGNKPSNNPVGGAIR